MDSKYLSVLVQKLESAAIPFYSLYEDGRIHFKPEATAQQRQDAAAIVAAFDPTVEDARREEIRQAPLTARQWLVDNPQAKQIFSLSVADLNSQVAALIDASFPLLTAGQRATWKLLMMAILLTVRVMVKRELE